MRAHFVILLAVVACTPTTVAPTPGVDCTQEGTCPTGLTCFPDHRCWTPHTNPGCSPDCYGEEPFCDTRTLRCVACLADTDCPDGKICVAPLQRCQPGCNAAKTGCPAGLHCDLALGACRGCLTDAECTDPNNPKCDVASGQCAPCVEDPDGCPTGQFCNTAGGTAACSPGCKAKGECGADEDCCGHRCVNTTSSGEHCGFCDNACRGNKTCCSGRCADIAADIDNCSACGNSCELPNVTAPTCTSATCSHGGCEFYFGNCDGDWSNGCEANFSFNAQHCGQCNRVCPSPGPHLVGACDLGNCTSACAMGWGDCNAAQIDGCEVDLSNSATHCGRCNNPCSGTCTNGQCT